MITIMIILFCWYLKAFADAIIFGKLYNESAYELWHIIDWIRFWILAGYILYLSKTSWIWIIVLIILSFLWNLLYKIFRFYFVYKLDNKFRIKWLTKIIDREGII